MFSKERLWIQDQLEQLCSLGTNAIAIDIGAGTPEYREIQQPYIFDLYRYIMFERGLKITTLDFDPNSEADIICDLSQDDIPQLGLYDLVICSNFFEHIDVTKLELVRKRILSMTNKYLIVTLPSNLPHHGRPIDNMLRPTIEELIALFPKLIPIAASNWVDNHYREPFISQPDLAPCPEVTGIVFLKPNLDRQQAL